MAAFHAKVQCRRCIVAADNADRRVHYHIPYQSTDRLYHNCCYITGRVEDRRIKDVFVTFLQHKNDTKDAHYRFVEDVKLMHC